MEHRETKATFGSLLRHFRRAAGLSQEGLAERARLSAVAISALERGTRQAPHRHTVALLAAALRLPADDRVRFESSAARASRSRSGEEPADDAGLDNLPLRLTSLHGREDDLERLGTLVAERRLVTLCGVGGVGKTRLAVETARRRRLLFSDGAWLVELAAVVDPAMVPARIAGVLNIEEVPGRPLLQTLATALREREVLLVLDNCEHLLDAVAHAANALLEGCARVHVVATSREPLRVQGERVQQIAPLPAAAAVGLFVERSADAGTAIALAQDHDVRRAIVAICERLDGIPLAIELAAARTSVLGVHGLGAQIGDRFRLLTYGARTAPARHQTLHATLGWSHALLSEAERIAFRRLAIFVDGWTLAAAQSVCADGVAVVESDVLALLGSLIEKSLVVAQHDGVEPRYTFLETVHAYARERLAQSGERESTALRLAAFVRTSSGLAGADFQRARVDVFGDGLTHSTSVV